MNANISCNNNCALMIKSVRVEGDAGAPVQIYIPTVALQNHQRIKLIICQNIPQGVGQVFINDDSTEYPLMTRTGNYVRADQLRCRKCYELVFGSDPLHFSALCWLKPSCYDELQYNLTPPPAQNSGSETPSAAKAK